MSTRPLVAVCLGTDHHPFDRLLAWVGYLAANSPCDWFVQHGHTSLPDGLDGEPLLPVDALQGLLTRADAVITHGGPGLIMEARAVGHRPIVVARDPSLGEHVDGHQQRFVARIGGSGMIVPVATRNQLRTAIGVTVTTGHTSPAPLSSGSWTVRRFGDLVENLVGPPR